MRLFDSEVCRVFDDLVCIDEVIGIFGLLFELGICIKL